MGSGYSLFGAFEMFFYVVSHFFSSTYLRCKINK